ncbi:MAG: S8 family peptidase [Lachnospiraceae bacterium]|nr:S8 family peptidase [Lachnospiraceae bacterium]
MNNVRRKLQIDEILREGIIGKDINIVIMDTGVARHPDLDGKIICFKDFVRGSQNGSFKSSDDGIDKMYDDNGHGTHIAGICAGSGYLSKGRYKGVAPGARLIVLKVLDNKGIGKEENIIKACNWILDNKQKYKIDIINISFGTSEINKNTQIMNNCIENMWDKDIVVVASAGNSGPKNDTVTSPGINSKIITVGALENNEVVVINNKRLTDYSGRGKEGEYKPEVLAPANRIVSCNNLYNLKSYTNKSGTSMATPIVSGCIALYKSVYKDCDNNQIKLNLCKSCTDLFREKNRQGYGLIDIRKFIYKNN